jgi:hypothetical protein
VREAIGAGGVVPYRARTDGWTSLQKLSLAALYSVAFFGIISFLMFDYLFIKDVVMNPSDDPRMREPKAIIGLILGCGFFLSLQFGWIYAVWKIHALEHPWKMIAIAILPLLLTSVPLAILVFAEMTREPQPRQIVI